MTATSAEAANADQKCQHRHHHHHHHHRRACRIAVIRSHSQSLPSSVGGGGTPARAPAIEWDRWWVVGVRSVRVSGWRWVCSCARVGVRVSEARRSGIAAAWGRGSSSRGRVTYILKTTKTTAAAAAAAASGSFLARRGTTRRYASGRPSESSGGRRGRRARAERAAEARDFS